MPNGNPTPEQIDAIAAMVAGKCVHDLGAGDCVLSMLLLELGARRIFAIDEHLRGLARLAVPDLHLVSASFEEYCTYSSAAEIELAFVSWPVNRRAPGMLELVKRSKRVIYLGSNTDCNACGGLDLLEHFLTRELLQVVPARPNTLLVLGDRLPQPREPTGEEQAGIDAWRGGEVVSFEDALAMTKLVEPMG